MEQISAITSGHKDHCERTLCHPSLYDKSGEY